MVDERLEVVDLNYLGTPETIPLYLIKHAEGAAIVDCGPGTTLRELEKALKDRDYRFSDLTDVFLTHIHLDHAGAAGFLARQGATIHVHPKGAGHLINPEKLLDSAKRIYGEKMDELWGEFLPVPEERLHVVEDEEIINIGDLSVKAYHTPGHAVHHVTYVYNGVCFTGDVGGSRLPNQQWISLPMPPPDLHIETWLDTVNRLKRLKCKVIAPTHFGFFEDVEWHLDQLEKNLYEVLEWLSQAMKDEPSLEVFEERFFAWNKQKIAQYPMSDEMRKRYEAANPAWMSPAGLYRYWNKYKK